MTRQEYNREASSHATCNWVEVLLGHLRQLPEEHLQLLVLELMKEGKLSFAKLATLHTEYLEMLKKGETEKLMITRHTLTCPLAPIRVCSRCAWPLSLISRMPSSSTPPTVLRLQLPATQWLMVPSSAFPLALPRSRWGCSWVAQ